MIVFLPILFVIVMAFILLMSELGVPVFVSLGLLVAVLIGWFIDRELS